MIRIIRGGPADKTRQVLRLMYQWRPIPGEILGLLVILMDPEVPLNLKTGIAVQLIARTKTVKSKPPKDLMVLLTNMIAEGLR